MNNPSIPNRPPLPAHDVMRPYITGTRGNPDLYSAHQVRTLLAQDRAARSQAAPEAEAVKVEEEPLSANKVIDSLVTALREIEWSNDTNWQSQRARDVLWDNHYMPAKERPLATPTPQAAEPSPVEAVSEDTKRLRPIGW